jgi:hypothetical protein
MITHPTDSGKGVFYCLVGGPAALLWGLARLKEKRLIENTPCSKVRSAAMGLVGLEGQARPRKPQKAPLSGLDCCWWRCEVQELRSSGKESHWVTIREVVSPELFYLEDTTGRVTVDPAGAEFHIALSTFGLNTTTRSMLGPILNGWGVNDLNWIGMTNSIRIREFTIPEYAPLYVLGDLINVQGHLDDRQQRFLERLKAIKADPKKIAEADVNRDGTIDAEEWDTFRMKQEEEFLKEEMSKTAQVPLADQMLVKAPASGNFIVSTEPGSQLVGSFQWAVPLAIAGGIALSAAGVWFSLQIGWTPAWIFGMLAGGFVVGGLIGRKGGSSWVSLFW